MKKIEKRRATTPEDIEAPTTRMALLVATFWAAMTDPFEPKSEILALAVAPDMGSTRATAMG